MAVNSRIQRSKTLSATSRSRAACATAKPRSVTNLTASILNSRLNFRLVISTLQFLGHDLIFVSTKPAAAQIGVPMVLRTQGGTGRSAGAQHSQSLEAYVMHTPGLRLAMPATVADAYHLLRAALRQPDPVVFIEHKALYALKEEVDLAVPVAPWGKAAIRRQGGDLVIVTHSRQVHHALAAAEDLARGGIEACVIDLRTLNPLDFDTVRGQVERVGRAMVLSEGAMTAGVAAELSARIHEECFDFLHDPVVRLAGEDIPISVSPQLELHSVPTVDLVREMALRLVG